MVKFSSSLNGTQLKLAHFMLGMTDFLLMKNQNYGDSALNPVRVFKNAGAGNSIATRINDKLSRIMNGPEHPRRNDVLDLIGYLSLYATEQGWQPLEEEEYDGLERLSAEVFGD